MVAVTYHCPSCGAVTALDREGYLNDDCVTREPLEGWRYVSTTANDSDADGIEIVCLGNVDAPATDRSRERTRDDGGPDDPNPEKDGCGRTYYLNFVRYENGQPVDHREPSIDPPRFDFNA